MIFKGITDAKRQTKLCYLGKVNYSAKLKKNSKVNQSTYGLYLSPANTSGYNVCSHSTKECRMGCLANSGRAKIEEMAGFNTIKNSRIKKTRLLFENTDFFMNWLIHEIKIAHKKALKMRMEFSVRLNCTSDVNWSEIKINGKNIFEIFPQVQFYDYTKDPNRYINKPNNYHLTYSYTGRNWNECEKLLKKGYNVAMVFNIKNEKELPTKYKGYPVVNGDSDDYRVKDGNGVIIGLKFKKIANKVAEKYVLNSCFVVQPNDPNCSYEQINVSVLQTIK